MVSDYDPAHASSAGHQSLDRLSISLLAFISGSVESWSERVRIPTDLVSEESGVSFSQSRKDADWVQIKASYSFGSCWITKQRKQMNSIAIMMKTMKSYGCYGGSKGAHRYVSKQQSKSIRGDHEGRF